jgi:mono/diheme cytochrome c family protein
MKKVLKIVFIILALFAVAITGLLGYVTAAMPDVAVEEDLRIDYSQERIERGKYLANNVAMCIDCHSERDFTRFGGPVIPGTEGKGGEKFSKELGFPGDFYAPNITPAALGDWTDGELFRAITAGVSKDGHALFPLMPYPNIGQMTREDVYSIVAYIRTLRPIENNVPKSEPAFPINVLINTMPQEANFTTFPADEELVPYGKYIFTSASCSDCHTPMDKGERIADKFVAGGMEFNFPDGTVVRSSNITPDKLTGIGAWTEKQFIARFKMYSDSTYVPYKVGPGEFKTVMPWSAYTKMDEQDLRAIFAYLQTVQSVSNKVVKFEEREKTE